MRLYFYCIMNEVSEPDFYLRGIDNQKVFFIHNRNLYAAVSATNTMQYENTDKNIHDHEKIIEIFMKQYPVLPFKFNSVVGEKIGRGILVKYYKELQKNLSRVQNRVEYLVRAVKKNSNKLLNLNKNIQNRNINHNNSKEIFKSKIFDIKNKVFSRQINLPLDSIAFASNVEFLPSETVILSGEYLMDKDKTDEFDKELSNLRALYPHIIFFSIGKRPPYCFNVIDITKDNTVKLKKNRR